MKNFKKNKKDFWNKSTEILEKCENSISSMEKNKSLEKSLEPLFKPFENFLDKFEKKYLDPNKDNNMLFTIFFIIKIVILIIAMLLFYTLPVFMLGFIFKKIFNSGIILSKSGSQFLIACGNILQHIVMIPLIFCFFYFVIKFLITTFEMVVGIVIAVREGRKEKIVKK